MELQGMRMCPVTGKPTLAMCCAVVACLCASGADYTMNSVNAYPYLNHATNYVDEVAPPNITAEAGLGDTIYATNELSTIQTLKLGNGNYYIGSVVGDKWRMFDHSATDGNWWKRLTVKDMSRFDGLFFVSVPMNALEFRADAEVSARLPQVDMGNGLQMIVKGGPSESLSVGKASGLGNVYFNNRDVNATTAGGIEVDDPLFGSRSTFAPGYGKISLAGNDGSAEIVGDPYLHLDATRPASLTWTETGGQRRVTRWDDARGGDGRPYAYSTANKFVPWLSSDPATGNAVVDFGVSACDYAWPVDNCWAGRRTGGYTGYSGTTLGLCGWLKLNEKCSTIREVFVVMKEAHIFNCQAFFLGNDTGPDEGQAFRRGWANEDPPSGGSKYEGVYYMFPRLFRTQAQTSVTRLGDVRLDGQRVMPNLMASLSDRFHVLSVGTIADAAADRIADNGLGTCNTSTRKWAVGGFAMGEMLIYTNVLTSAERSKVNRYLKRKWSVGEDREDVTFGQANIGAGITLDVPSGTITAKKTSLSGGSLAKTGAGAYEGGVPPAGPFSMDVREGSVSFRKHFEPGSAPAAPAGDSDIWLDADNRSSLVLSNATEGTAVYVTKIRHCENGGTNSAGYAAWATRYSATFAYPTLVEDSDVGRYVFDTGPYVATSTPADGSTVVITRKEVPRSAKASETYFDNTGEGHLASAGFVVFKASDSKATIIGSPATALYRDTSGNGCLLADVGSSSRYIHEYFALDGDVINPRFTSISDNEYHVLSYRFSEPRSVITFGGRKSGTSGYGGVRVGEWIQYERLLSDAEFRDTEAYLMNKWLGKAHPDVEKASGSAGVEVSRIDYGTNAVAELATDYDMAVGHVYSAAGAFSKAGDGTMSVGGLSCEITNVTVSGGSLAAGAGVEDIMAHALFRFDASDASTLTVAGDGSISEWRDKNGNGYKARPLNDATFVIPNVPHLVDETINGVAKKVVDFGTICPVAKSGSTYTVTNDASAFQLYKPDGTTGWSGNMREWIVVAKDMKTGRVANDREIGNEHAPIISGSQLTWRYLDELHDYMHHPAFTVHRGVNNGYYALSVDSMAVSYNYRLWEKLDRTNHTYHVFNMAYLTNHVDWTFQVRHLGGDLCRYSNCAMFGGQRLCEVMVFDTPLSSADRAIVKSYLMRKWQSKDSETIPERQLGAVQVAAGASLAMGLSGWSAVSVDKLGGGGSLQLDRTVDVNDNAVFEVSMPAANTVEKLTVDGTLTLPSVATVKVDVVAGLGTSGLVGRYPILSATSLGAAGISGWRLEVPAWTAQFVSATLERSGDTVYLRFFPKGTLLIFR